jgi:metallophosphoesterase superfamily enzyme
VSKTAGTHTSVEYANALKRKGICLAKMKQFRRAIDIHKQAMSLYKAIINGDSRHMSVKSKLAFSILLCA